MSNAASAEGVQKDFAPPILASLGITKSSRIRVAGSGGLGVMIWLCRRGFDDVGYVRADRCGTADSVDCLLVTHACGPDQVAELLANGPRLRDRGVLAFHCDRSCRAAIRDMLAARGFAVEFGPEGGARSLCIARRPAAEGVLAPRRAA